MKIRKAYLDNSALNRPFDDQSVPNIRLEAVAALSVKDYTKLRKELFKGETAASICKKIKESDKN